MDEILKDLKRVGCYLDDLLIGGSDEKECEEKLHQVLERLELHNIRVNFEKCKWFQTEVEYLGHVISGNGIRANKEKIRAILEAPSPRNARQLKSFFWSFKFL